ncbi:hypothetical protein [Brevibacillus brevis]
MGTYRTKKEAEIEAAKVDTQNIHSDLV